MSAAQDASGIQEASAYQSLRRNLTDCLYSRHAAPEPTFDNKPEMPTRVVDCQRLRLVVADGMRQPWISLSHCWGTKPGLRTTKTNYQNMLASIEIESLPATIRDAIIFTQRIGFQYLWVDSLCIIQPEQPGDADAQKDWGGEVLNMHRYYKESAATLVIELAAGDEEGFLDALDCGEHYRITRTPVVVPVGADGKQIVFEFGDDPYYNSEWSLRYFLAEETPHRHRAWTLQ
jgi:hypothetical protein